MSFGGFRASRENRWSPDSIHCFASAVFLLTNSSFFLKFVDHNMYMCYFGGGVGHLGKTSSHIHQQASSKVSESFIEAEVDLEPQDVEIENNILPGLIIDSDEELDNDSQENFGQKDDDF